jgi:hypothetical protein
VTTGIPIHRTARRTANDHRGETPLIKHGRLDEPRLDDGSAVGWHRLDVFAFGFSIVISAGLWGELLNADELFGDGGPSLPGWPAAIPPLLVLLILSPLVTGAAIVVDLLAGAMRGRSRILAVIGGLLLLSPAVGFVVSQI